MNNLKKILLINFGGIGDEILFLPTIQSLKNIYPNSVITLALEKRSKSIKDLTSLIDSTIELDIKGKSKYFELLKFLISVRKQKFDIVISSGSNKFIPILLFLTGIKERYGYNTSVFSKLLLTKSVVLNKQQYAVDMYHDLLKPIYPEIATLPKIEINNITKVNNTILIHPGVSKMSIIKNIIKTPSIDFWVNTIEVLLQYDKKVWLVGGPDDEETINKILLGLKNKKLLDNFNFVNFYGKTKNILDLAKLIKSAEVLLCTDSAPMHIGVAVRTKVFAIFGPTDEKKLLPLDETFVPICKRVDCRPCLWDQRNTSCDKKKCLEFVADDIIEILKEKMVL